jgi:hypothetical protein
MKQILKIVYSMMIHQREYIKLRVKLKYAIFQKNMGRS